MISLLSACYRTTSAQIIEDYLDQRKAANKLYERGDFVGAASILEMLARSNPDDVEVIHNLTFSLYASTASIKEAQKRAGVREKARMYLEKARELGDHSSLMKVVEDGLSTSDTERSPFSDHADAEVAMRDGEDAFVHGEYDKAISLYGTALKKDPNLDLAAIFTGDVYFKKGVNATDKDKKKEFLETADKWFAKAVSIEENRETAYRYWGDSLVAEGRMREAGDKFIDAIIADPGSRLAFEGLNAWAERNQISLTHPVVEHPGSPADSNTSGGDKDEHSSVTSSESYWSHYGVTRASWKAKLFKIKYPRETKYRHSVQEEADALASVAEAISRDRRNGKTPRLSTSLSNVLNLYQDGLLEPFVFYTRVDDGIAQDYAGYRILHRDRLHRYWADYVVGGKH